MGMIIITIILSSRIAHTMKPIFTCILSFTPLQVMAHEGPLFSAEHADYLGLCLIAIGVLLATIATWGPLVIKGQKAEEKGPTQSHQPRPAGPAITLVFSRDD